MAFNVSVAVVLWSFATAVLADSQDARRIAAGDASISGRVVDNDSQRGLESVLVTLTTTDWTTTLTTLTDSTGRYLFEGIAPGEYGVTASHHDYVTKLYGGTEAGVSKLRLVTAVRKQATTGIDFSLMRGGSITGRIIDQNGNPVKGAIVTALQIKADGVSRLDLSRGKSSNHAGEYFITNLPDGLYQVGASWVDSSAVKARAGIDPRPTYFPGTAKREDATPVRVLTGETVRNIDIRLAATDLFRVTGHVVRGTSDARIEATLLSAGTSVRTVEVADDGAFEITHLRPARYVLWTRAQTTDGAEAAWAVVDVTADVTGLVLPMTTTSTVAGRVVTDDGSPLPAGALQVAGILLDGGKQIDPLPRDRAEVTQEGTFELHGLFGDRALHVSGLGNDWVVDRILIGKTVLSWLSLAAGEQLRNVTVVMKRNR